MARKNRRNEFAVIGLGRFGSNLARQLVQRGCTVLAIDRDRALVQSLADELTQVVAMDSTDEDALRALDIGAFDVVVVAIGSSFESNLMTTLALKSLGAKRIICKAMNERQCTVLLAIGANEVLLPEQESARRLAQTLTMPLFVDQIAMGNRYNITEMKAPASFVGKKLSECNLRQNFGVSVVAIEKDNHVIISPPADYVFEADDRIALVGANEQIERLGHLE
ncbi:MAG: TrkA family potassium uptake protein [Anaerolineae bacterium]|nr:TrkA family potassium uptake protein [Anaerolineae bacterium]MCB9132048.1 TrkA family potassium uptake protein [Anaerolineales bacterium]MCB0235165.1 TrkA family potassium uptake protein [Anaerolineae bacterium]MCB0239059.1 TrkA family potassium uptake protein [Anaerolineae bacterium]MCB0247736.1 TrkA family potassium uptake protein [Anaerolineae bacterium]